MRHGDAEAYSGEDSDAARQLTTLGHAGNRKMAEQLSRKQRAFDGVWVSPYVRAQQTADDVLIKFPDSPRELCDMLTPESSPQDLLDAVTEAAGDTLLLIGHNPLVSRFVALLTDGNTATERYLGTSDVVAIETEVVAPACGAIKYYLAP